MTRTPWSTVAVALLGSASAAAQPAPTLRITPPAPVATRDAPADRAVTVVVDAPDVREVNVTVNHVATRAPVVDGRASVPLGWAPGNNRIIAEASSGGRALRDSVTVFFPPTAAPEFLLTVSCVDGRPCADFPASLDGPSDPGRRLVHPMPGTWRVFVGRETRARRPHALVSTGDGRPARLGPRVRVEVRLLAGTEREQRWVFDAFASSTGEVREVGSFDVTSAMLAPGAAP